MMTQLPGNKRTASLPAWSAAGLFFIYTGYCMGKVGKLNLSTFFIDMKYMLLHPFPFEITEWTSKYILLCILAWGIIFTMYTSSLHNYLAGREYGASRFARPEELNKVLQNKRVDDNKKLSQNLRLSRDGKFTKLNNNMIILGGAGAGKTMFMLTPNLLEIREKDNGYVRYYMVSLMALIAGLIMAVSYLLIGKGIFAATALAGLVLCFVFTGYGRKREETSDIPIKRVSKIFTDSKGEILRDNGNYCQTRGDKVLVFNLIEMEKSHHYNPLVYIRNENDIIKLVTNLISNTTPKDASKGEPFWENAEAMLLMSVLYYVWLECDIPERNFRKVLELLNKAEIHEDDDPTPSDLDILMNDLQPEHPARLAYKKVMCGAADTKRSILISAQARLKFLQNEKVLSILDYDEMNLPEIGRGVNYDGETVTDLFCVIPDNDKSYNFLVGMLYTQLFQELYYQADFECGGSLDVPVEFWLDEFANVALPDDFISLESTMRSRGISVNVIIQFMAQLKYLFKDLEEGVPANCDVFVYLGGNEQSSHKYVAERLGDWTIEKRSTSESMGHNGSSSKSNDVLGRKLMMADEVGRLDNRKEIVFIRGQYPVLDWKYQTFKTPEFKESRKLGHYMKIEREEFDGMHFMNEKEVEHIRKNAENSNQVIRTYRPDWTDVMGMDISLLSETDPDGSDINLEEIFAETKEERRASFEAETQMRAEIAEKEAIIEQEKMKDGQEISTHENPQDAMSYAERIVTFPFTEAQKNQAMLGVEHGLPEDIILQYFRIEISAENMALMREVAEKTLKSKLGI